MIPIVTTVEDNSFRIKRAPYWGLLILLGAVEYFFYDGSLAFDAFTLCAMGSLAYARIKDIGLSGYNVLLFWVPGAMVWFGSFPTDYETASRERIRSFRKKAALCWLAVLILVVWAVNVDAAGLDEPTKPTKLLILDYYPIEYCIAALNLSTTILDKESPKNFSRYDAQTTALLWYLTTPELDSDVTDLISMKMIDLLAKGNFTPEDMVAAGAECNITYLLMLQKGI